MSGNGRGKRPRRQEVEENGEDQNSEARTGMTAFNLKDEKEEGDFDENGNFVWKKHERKVQEDAWLDNISETQIDQALHAKNRKERRDENEKEQMTIEKANSILSEILNSRETVLQGLQRLRPFKKKFQATNRKNKRKQQKETTEKQHQEEEKNVATSTDKVLFDRVTEAADFLMRMGEIDVYSQIREDFIPEQELLSQAADRQSRVQFTDSQQVTVSHHAKEKETMWEYKGADGQIHGPFPTSSIIAWRQQGYFTGGSAVDMRPIKSITLFQKGKEETLPPAAVAIGEPKKSAEQELLDDFEESEEEEETKSSEPVEAVVNEWKNSDTIDFSTF